MTADNCTDMHASDLAFMHEVREATDDHLAILLRFQACEEWKRIAIMREMTRRKESGL